VNPKIFIETPGWKFKIDEVSANVFVVVANDSAGRTIEKIGTDPDALLEECLQAVKQLLGV